MKKGTHPTEEARIKMSLAHKGKPSYRKGCHLTAETKAKLSVANKGKPSTFKGHRHTLESKAKMGVALRGKPQSREVIEKRAAALNGIALNSVALWLSIA